MHSRRGQKQASFETYSDTQVKRTLIACGVTIEGEIDSDFIVYCPYHSNFRTPAAEVSKESGQFYCFGCQESRALPELVMFTSKRNYFEALRLIESKSTGQDIESELSSILDKKPDFVEFDLDIINKLNKNALNNKRAAEYIKSRGISKDSVQKFWIGYSEHQDMITIPVHSPDGITLGFVGRSLEGKVFKNSPGLPRSKTLFNLFRNKRYERVFVVESAIDAIRLEQVGARAVATLGASVNSAQKDLLKRYFTSIILVRDNDEAGDGMKNKMQSYFGTALLTPSLPEYVKDVSDMDDTDLTSFVKTLDNEVQYLLQ